MQTERKTDKEDRRIRRTKALLRQGLIQLMEQKDIKDISVRELSDLADINRGTFYLHYSDIYDMLNKMEDELFIEFHEILDRNMDCSLEQISPETTFMDIFTFLERHRDLVKIMMGPHGDLAFVNRMKNLVKKRLYDILDLRQASCDYTYMEAFVVSGCTGVIEAWLNHPAAHTPKEIAAICSSMLPKEFSVCKAPENGNGMPLS